jgi:hypothetical protein
MLEALGDYVKRQKKRLEGCGNERGRQLRRPLVQGETPLPRYLIYNWLRSKLGWWQANLFILALCIAAIVFGLWFNPPSKVREEFYRAHPELIPKPSK